MTQPDLRALHESADRNRQHYAYQEPNAALLEYFETPKGAGTLLLEVEAPEFTCLCPITGQPDFATIMVTYIPGERCLESKSFKLYLLGFRMFGTFHEACVQRICSDLVQLLAPRTLSVTGQFAPRGGIPFIPTATYTQDDAGQ